jgi:hypothetical protein
VSWFFADADRELAGSLIVELKKESLVSSAQFLDGFRELVSHMAEKDQEIPRIYSHVAGEWSVFVTAEILDMWSDSKFLGVFV